ncbi:hypothetical protein NKR23_g5395 [Pleurostoma richardsiae]|uniref:Uncharacterized protein n=1 Tax=Pleurostoma richardsiae TaxID=41990 RepID=A0AA38RGS2_9PEZI|nr:hypothetical protein NKR23_g5395 [Pleurostoma richardsiae]
MVSSLESGAYYSPPTPRLGGIRTPGIEAVTLGQYAFSPILQPSMILASPELDRLMRLVDHDGSLIRRSPPASSGRNSGNTSGAVTVPPNTPASPTALSSGYITPGPCLVPSSPSELPSVPSKTPVSEQGTPMIEATQTVRIPLRRKKARSRLSEVSTPVARASEGPSVGISAFPAMSLLIPSTGIILRLDSEDALFRLPDAAADHSTTTRQQQLADIIDLAIQQSRDTHALRAYDSESTGDLITPLITPRSEIGRDDIFLGFRPNVLTHVSSPGPRREDSPILDGALRRASDSTRDPESLPYQHNYSVSDIVLSSRDISDSSAWTDAQQGHDEPRSSRSPRVLRRRASGTVHVLELVESGGSEDDIAVVRMAQKARQERGDSLDSVASWKTAKETQPCE